MARSTKLERLITEPLNTRLTAAEAKVTTIETRSLVDEGDNVSLLTNDAGYQNATQVDTKIQAVVGAAPAALDTLKEIADALADDDDAIAALVAADTVNAAAITALDSTVLAMSGQLHNPVTIGATTTALSLEGQELSLYLDPNPENLLSQSEQGLYASYNINELAFDLSEISGSSFSEIFYFLNRKTAIRRLQITGNETLTEFHASRQHLINQTTGVLQVILPASPYANEEFEVINASISTQNLIFAGETVLPGTRHAVQWDGVEWVVM